MSITIITLIDGHIQKFPQDEDSKVKPLSEDGRKGKKQACSAQGKAKGKETGKATLHKKTGYFGGQKFQYIHKKSGQEVRLVRKGNKSYLRTLDKKRKESSKVG